MRTTSWKAAFALLVAFGCEQGAPTAPRLEERVVVHAVLDPQLAEQVVLLERTQQGASPSGTAAKNAMDPIVSSGGTPISGARVVLYGSGTDSVVAVEDRSRRTDGMGGGVYRVPSRMAATTDSASSPGILRLSPGVTYRLRAETALGTVTGTTRMPRFPTQLNRAVRVFNLDTDSLWRPRMKGAGSTPAGYLLRHLMSGGVNRERLAADSTAVLVAPAPLADDRSWSFAFTRAYIRPGSIQRFVAVAVDSNYLEYSMSGYDPFGHDAKGNRLDGGVGLFGAVATVVDASLDLIANRDHPIEGDWNALVSSSTLPLSLRLYESARFPGPAGATGVRFWGSARMAGGELYLAEAHLSGSALQLTLTLPGSAKSTGIAGTFDGSSLTLNVPGTGLRVRYQLSAAR